MEVQEEDRTRKWREVNKRFKQIHNNNVDSDENIQEMVDQLELVLELIDRLGLATNKEHTKLTKQHSQSNQDLIASKILSQCITTTRINMEIARKHLNLSKTKLEQTQRNVIQEGINWQTARFRLKEFEEDQSGEPYRQQHIYYSLLKTHERLRKERINIQSTLETGLLTYEMVERELEQMTIIRGKIIDRNKNKKTNIGDQTQEQVIQSNSRKTIKHTLEMIKTKLEEDHLLYHVTNSLFWHINDMQ